MINISSKLQTPIARAAKTLRQIPKEKLAADFPLEKVDIKELEGIQSGIPLFDGISLEEIKFLVKNFSVLNIARGCASGCGHCLRDAKLPNGQSLTTILWDDLKRFAAGFESLNERLGVDVLKGNKYLVLHDDFNPPEFLAKDINGNSFNFADAVKLVFEKLHIPIETVTSGWNKADMRSQKAVEELVDYYIKHPEANSLTSVSINPFHSLMAKSFNAADAGKPEQARFWKEIYTNRIAHAIKEFLPLFKENKASLIYRHAGADAAERRVGAKETFALYTEVYDMLKKLVGEDLKTIESLNPQRFEKSLPQHFIEPKGRGRKYFSQSQNIQKQQELIQEKIAWNNASPAEKVQDAYNYTIKEIDINGDVYAGTLSENLVKTGISLNYKNKGVQTPEMFSDIKLSQLESEDIKKFLG